MKHLKKFNESYDSVSNSMIFFEDKDWAQIDYYESRILDYLKSANYPVSHEIKVHDFGNKVQMLHVTSANHIILKTLSGHRWAVPPMEVGIAVDSDEWFYVEITSNSAKASSNSKTYYYKCDQLEGLLELLKDKVISSK